MRKYEDEQIESTMFQGEQARRIIDIRQQMDAEAERICEELHSAINTAEKKFSDLGQKYQSQFVSELNGTDLDGVPLEEVGFDFTNADKHGVVFARRKSNPIAAFLKMLRTVVEDGPNPTSDSILVEEKQPSAFRRWGQREPA